jgi:hypothetical protein
MVNFIGPGAPMSQAGIDAAAAVCKVDRPVLWAVVAVETLGSGFLTDRRPNILFERHYFSRLTGGRYDVEDPDVSQPSQGGYGQGGAHQYDRLEAAIVLDEAAALQSASWGLGQVMGANFKSAGYNTVQDMVAAMVASEDNQLAAMAKFIDKNGMSALLGSQNWAGFARRYNGPNYASNNYDGLLRHFYQIYSAGPVPDLKLREAQVYLSYKGYPVGTIDGVPGPHTTDAIKKFQADKGLTADGIVSDALLQALMKP